MNFGQKVDLTSKHTNLAARHRISRVWKAIFQFSIIFGILSLITLILNIANQSFGYSALISRIDPASLSEMPLNSLTEKELGELIKANLSNLQFRRIEKEKPLDQREKVDLLQIITDKVLEEKIIKTWTLSETFFNKKGIVDFLAREYPTARLEFRSWVTPSLIFNSMSSNPELAGIRTALIGSMMMIAITILFSAPIGIGSAIFLEEYARKDRWYNHVIQLNIENLAGVPSIVYGILGLAIFVRALGHFTSGNFLGYSSGTGRTLLSGGLTMGLLVLPVIIINAQEAIRAVPLSLRQAGYGLGATKWQVIWHHVLPQAFSGILTGSILAISRALGETAPLIIVGASTFLTSDPKGPFSAFTVLPIQIYNWTTRPQDAYRNLAAAAIIVLLITLLSLNTFAILYRNKLKTKNL